MPIITRCSCGQKLKVANSRAGQTAKCPQCGEWIDVPDPIGDNGSKAYLLRDDTKRRPPVENERHEPAARRRSRKSQLPAMLLSFSALCLAVGVLGIGVWLLMNHAPTLTTSRESDARAFLDTEFVKWINGDKSAVETLQSKLALAAPPIGYEIISLIETKPDILCVDVTEYEGNTYKEFPAYRVSVNISFRSEARTELKRVATYCMMWDPAKKKWSIRERH